MPKQREKLVGVKRRTGDNLTENSKVRWEEVTTVIE